MRKPYTNCKRGRIVKGGRKDSQKPGESKGKASEIIGEIEDEWSRGGDEKAGFEPGRREKNLPNSLTVERGSVVGKREKLKRDIGGIWNLEEATKVGVGNRSPFSNKGTRRER